MARTHSLTIMLVAAASAILLAGCPDNLAEITKAAYAFVDEDGDAVCDTCGQGEDSNGDGVCDNFIDADSDGVCDNRQSHLRLGWGPGGYQFRDANGDGQCDMCGGQDADGDGVCDSFVDANGDGICDHQHSHAQHGNGNGHGGGQSA